MKLLRNLKTVISCPKFAFEYVDYFGSRLLHGRPRRVLPGGIAVSSFSGFSEFHSVGDFVNSSERAFFTTFPFGRGDMFDIGANLGVISLLLAKNRASSNIFAFEPNPSTFAALLDNMRLNNAAGVKPQQAVVSDVDGTISFAANPLHRGTASIAKGAQTGSTALSVTLDSFIKQQSVQSIAIIKVDVEGYETSVFAGARETLKRRLASVIYYEVCPEVTRHAGFEPLAPTNLLQAYGYEIFALKPGDRLERIDPAAQIGAAICENWIGLLPEQVVAAGSWIR
jgi:FkbM family methyltransferase